MKKHSLVNIALFLLLLAGLPVPALAHEEDESPFLADETAADVTVTPPAMPDEEPSRDAAAPDETAVDAAAAPDETAVAPDETAPEFASPADFQPLPPEMLPPQDFYQAAITQISEEGTDPLTGDPYQIIEAEITSGNEKDKTVTIEHGKVFLIRDYQKVKKNDTVILAKTGTSGGETAYFIYDKYRIAPVLIIAAIFFVLVVFFGRKKGLGSMLGLAVSLLILSLYIVPNILSGGSPLITSIIGAFIIAAISLYLAHGFNKQSSIALISTIITLGISAILAIIFVDLSALTGAGSEEAYFLQFGTLEKMNLKGLLLGGIIIGALGVLDDITTGQTAAVREIFKANRRLDFSELYHRGLSVGREHIASLVNTLALAYAGASLPMFLIFSTNDIVPLWVNLNSESIVEEIIRTLVGSSALVFAVPISTALAAYAFSKERLLKD